MPSFNDPIADPGLDQMPSEYNAIRTLMPPLRLQGSGRLPRVALYPNE
ncbi:MULTISPECIES: hypothetical protein [Pseudomonas]|uniref:Uncharacterized protein n=1 Tax=Pseudomonas izuensis TaxID=2684212 RepID=A0ABM7RNT0_9PSED|nr:MULTISPECIES: hypothetical protein [Pseudomonas]RKS28405.1 hypothetical protein BJ917_1281 [Pseudomonas sp. WPR_5_2]BCX67380.1 hypothetical protein LAB08_R20150 [Pseudomonas izuensis]